MNQYNQLVYKYLLLYKVVFYHFQQTQFGIERFIRCSEHF